MRFGFSPDRPLEVMDALLRHPNAAALTAAFDAPHGVKFYFDGPLATPDERSPFVRTVWQIDSDGDDRTARFITLEPRAPAGSGHV